MRSDVIRCNINYCLLFRRQTQGICNLIFLIKHADEYQIQIQKNTEGLTRTVPRGLTPSMLMLLCAVLLLLLFRKTKERKVKEEEEKKRCMLNSIIVSSTGTISFHTITQVHIHN